MGSDSISPRKRITHVQVSGLEAHLGFWLRFVSNHVSGTFRKLIEKNGVTVSEWVALRALYGSGSSTHAVLVESLGMTKGAVSKVLDRLEKKRLARRKTNLEGVRSQRIALTRAGRSLVPRLAALADENDQHFFGCLSPDRRRMLAQMLREIVRTHRLTQVPTD